MNSARKFSHRSASRLGRKSDSKRDFVRRGLLAERLESRNMLAADWFVSDYWNGARPEDVNADHHISPVDALLIINQLNISGSRQLMSGAAPQDSSAEGEGGEGDGTFYDVNNDGFLSPIDSLLVINALNGEGEPDLMQYRIYVVNVGTQVTELATPPASITSISKGQDYEMVVTVKDLRSGSQFGVAAGYLDIFYDKSLTSVHVNELQDILISGNPTGGEFRLTFGGQNTATITYDPFDTTTTRNAIDAALEALSTIGANNVQVTTESNGFRVRFVNGLGDQDVGALSVFSSNLTGGTSPTATIQQVADGVITNSVAFEDAFRSRVGYPNGSNQAFYRGQPLFNAGDFPDRVDDLGGAYLTVDPPHPGTFERELSRVRMNANDAGILTFTPSLASIVSPAHDTLLYASQPQDRSEVDPDDIDLGPVVTLTITELIVANPDVVNIVEDASATTFNPIAGVPGGSQANGLDVKNAGSNAAPLRITAVNGQVSGTVNLPSGATVTFSGSTATPSITYTPAADFAGQDVFNYTISDTVNFDTTTVTVNVSPLNDAPHNRINGVDITGATPARVATEDAPFVFNAANSSVVSVSDVDAGAATNNEITLSVTNGALTLSTTTGLTPNGGANGTNFMVFTGSLASINNALNGMTFSPTANVNGNATLTIAYNDKGNTGGGDLTDSDNLTIAVAAVNDAPVNGPPGTPLPGAQTVDESPAVLTFSTANNNRIVVGDVDAGAATDFQVILNVLSGNLNVVNTGGVVIQNDNTSTVTVTGSLANINTALDGLQYQPVALFVGADRLRITSNDMGNTGPSTAQGNDGNPPDPLIDIDDVAINVIATVRPRAVPDSFPLVEGLINADLDVMFNDLAHMGPFDTTLLSFTQPAAGRGAVTRNDQGTNNGTPGDVSDDTPLQLSDDTLIYTPPSANFFGTVTFTYTINDTYNAPADGPGPDADSTATVTLTISGTNDPPTAVDDPGFTTPEDVPLTAPLLQSVLNNDTDPDNQFDTDGDSDIDVTDTLSAVIETNPLNGTVTLNLDGTFTYTPTLNYNGPDSFTYRARDIANAPSNIATVSINVTPVNDKPATSPDSYSVDEDATLTANGVNPNPAGVLANDNDGDPELVQVITVDLTSVTQPVDGTNTPRGTVNMIADGTFTYTPPANFFGTVTFKYRATDGQAQNPLSDLTTVTITVNPLNDPPVVANDSYTTFEDTPLVADGVSGRPVGVLNNDSDIDSLGIAVNFPLIDLPNNGTVVMNGNGTFTYTPNENFFGSDSFQYRATDGFATSNRGGTNDDGIATVTITVADANDRPVANPDSGPTFNTTEDVNLNVPATGVLANDTDGDPGQTLTAQIVAGSLLPVGSGTLTLSPNGAILFDPADNFFGTVTFQYQANDGQGQPNSLSLATTVTMIVSEVNDPPDAVNDNFTAIKDFEDQVVNVLANDTFAPDVGETLKVIAVQGVAADVNGDTAPQPTAVTGGTVRLDNFVVLYDSPPGHEGADSFTYTITDSRAVNPRTDTATVNVDVLAFIPKIVEGIVYHDSDNNGQIFAGETFTDNLVANGVYDAGEAFVDTVGGPRDNDLYDAPERRLQGVTIQLYGTDFQGNPVGSALNPIEVETDANGRYRFLGDLSTQFQGMKPGTYTVREVQPAYLMDGIESENSLLATLDGENQFEVSWGPEDFTGNITGLNFGEGYFNTNPATGGLTNSGGLLQEALLGSSRRNGVVVATTLGGDTIWSWAMPGWTNLSRVELILDADQAHATLRVWDANLATVNPVVIRIHQETQYNGHVLHPNSPPAGSEARFRILGRGANGEAVIRLDGTAAEFGLNLLAAAPVVGEGEAEGEASVDPNYAAAADAIFGEGESWA